MVIARRRLEVNVKVMGKANVVGPTSIDGTLFWSSAAAASAFLLLLGIYDLRTVAAYKSQLNNGHTTPSHCTDCKSAW